MIEFDLQAYITSNIDNLAVYPEHIPQGVSAYPYLVYSIESTDYLYNAKGYSGQATKTFTFEIVSNKVVDIYTYAESVRLLLQGFHGTIGTTIVQGALLMDSKTDSEQFDSSDKWLNWVTQTWDIRYIESIPTF